MPDLGAACAALFGLLAQAQGFNLQLVLAGLGGYCFALGLGQTRAGVGIGVFGASQCVAGFVVDEALGA